MNELAIDCDATREALVAFLRMHFERAGFSRGVVGLSGGVDSALSALLAVQALGPDAVLTLYMPYKSSDPRSREHARLVATKLATNFREIPITSQVDLYFEKEPEAGPVRRGNKMARERMSILFDQAAAWNGLVVGTSNRSEILLGYGTLYGDTACSINPLAGLLKNQVFQLARALGIPEEIITKPPTADLWAGQTDEEELGFRYSDVDLLLFHMFDRELSDAELARLGISAEFVKQIRLMVDRFEFKRRMPLMAGPPIKGPL